MGDWTVVLRKRRFVGESNCLSAAAGAARCGWEASNDDGWGLEVHEVSLEVQLSNAQTDERGNACVGKVESRSGDFNFLGGASISVTIRRLSRTAGKRIYRDEKYYLRVRR